MKITTTFAIFTTVLSIVICAWVAESAIEAKVYTKLTGKAVSVLDAMFVDLRVADGVKK